MDTFNDVEWYSNFDLKSGYWQEEMAEESIPLTAFSSANGHWEFLRVAFGLKNAPADFSRLMFRVLGNLSFVQIYFDDFYIASKSAEDHLNHLTIVIEKLKEANLKINFKKCNFSKSL